jgi:hypothetical protein
LNEFNPIFRQTLEDWATDGELGWRIELWEQKSRIYHKQEPDKYRTYSWGWIQAGRPYFGWRRAFLSLYFLEQ